MWSTPRHPFKDMRGHHSYVHNLDSCENKAWKSPYLNDIQTHHICITRAAVLSQLNYQTNWELVMLWVCINQSVNQKNYFTSNSQIGKCANISKAKKIHIIGKKFSCYMYCEKLKMVKNRREYVKHLRFELKRIKGIRDHCRYVHSLSRYENRTWNIFRLDLDSNHDLYNTSVVLYQLTYHTIWEHAMLWDYKLPKWWRMQLYIWEIIIFDLLRKIVRTWGISLSKVIYKN